MTELDEKIKAIAEKAMVTAWDSDSGCFTARNIEKAIYAGIRAFAEQAPLWRILDAGNKRMYEGADTVFPGTVEYVLWTEVYKAMMAEAIKALHDSQQDTER